MKKCLLALLIISFSLSAGCQPTPKSDVVVYKGHNASSMTPNEPGNHYQAPAHVPLRYNKDKRKNPVFSRVSAFVVAYSIPFPTLIASEKSVE